MIKLKIFGFAALLLAALSPLNRLGAETIDLSGSGWKLWQDKNAAWEKDELFLPPADLTKIPANSPTGGWEVLAQGVPVSVPGTTEGFLGKGTGPAEAVKGVTWWVRQIEIPASAEGKTIRLLFDSARQRAEVYVNQKLVGYDMVGNTPFEANLTSLVKPGEKVQLAVRITNPGGNFTWRDAETIRWGSYIVPMSHGFGGITGSVHLAITDPVYVDDLAVQNTPVPTNVNILATVKNTTGKTLTGAAEVVVCEKKSGVEVFRKNLAKLEFKPGEMTFSWPVSVADAKLWNLENPNLYQASVTLFSAGKTGDAVTRSFGFRWFAPEGIGSNAVFRLNGQRVVLRTAISWGFWPANGVFPSPELAAKEIQTAKDYGMNMLNFHRSIGNPISLEKADEMGLFYFEEPGGYMSGGDDPFAQALCREKLLRMVKRDRSHPSLIIYNMMNEYRAGVKESHRRDMRDAHAIDPSRIIVYTSAWVGRSRDPNVDPAKMHMRPFEETIYMNGWSDYHRSANGNAVWLQGFYQSPNAHYGITQNKSEIVYWGEEGAMSAPPRLGLIEQSLEKATQLGWDGQVYRDWFKRFDDYLTANNLRGAFPTVDDLCQAMGVINNEHQGRKIEDTRICDLNDGYAINGWESQVIENHSGVVDVFRNPKADPAIMAYYNQPLYVAVKPRRQITSFPGSVTVDFYLLNEKDMRGDFTLRIRGTTPAGVESFSTNMPVTATGGEVYGQLLAEAVEIPLTMAGMNQITATLVDAQGGEKAAGHDAVFAVDWKSIPITGKGAVFENGHRVRNFLKNAKGIEAPLFDNTQGKLDWLVVAKPIINEPKLIPADAFRSADGKTPGLKTSFFAGQDFSKPVFERTDSAVNFNILEGEMPDPHVPLLENFTVRWEGALTPPLDGEYTFYVKNRDLARLWLDDQQLFDESKTPKGAAIKNEFKVTLAAGKPVRIRVELLQKRGGAKMQLFWLTPEPETVTAAQILERARRDGTTVLILDSASQWLNPLAVATGVPQGQSFGVGTAWLGGQYFVKAHPLFAGLPVNQGMNWPYQGVLGGERRALDLRGGELVAGAWQSWPMQLGSAVSIIPAGQGKIIVSTLDLVTQLESQNSAAEVARRLFCNFLNFAAGKK